MARMKRGAWVASILTLVAVSASACNQPYSQPSAVTNTPIDPNSLFATPFAGEPTEISDVQIFGTQTVQAANTSAPVTASPTGGVAVTPQVATATSTPFVSLPSNPTVTPTTTLALPSLPTSTSAPSGARPSTYTLQSEEFPYCIARRYDLDPDSLLVQNQLSSGTVFYAGVVLNLSNVTSPFPGVRALRPHPAAYAVTGNADTTVYGVACKFGDLEPSSIVSANSSAGITLNSVLTIGQSLSIP